MFEKEKDKKEEESKIPLDYYSFFIAEYSEYENYEVKIFRRIRSTAGRFKKEFLGRFFDAPPEEELIAERWAPGDYTATSIDPHTGKMHSRDFSIAEDLRYLYKPQGQPPANFQPPLNASQNAPPLQQDPMNTMKEIFSGIVTPLVTLITQTQNKNNNNNGNGALPDTMQYMNQFMEGVMNTCAVGFGRMQTQMIDNTISNAKKIQPPKVAEVEAVEGGYDWTWVLDMVKKFGSQIFDKQGQVKEGALDSVQKNPMFADAINDQQKLDSLYFSLAADPNVGKVKADSLFNSIGIEPITDQEYEVALAGSKK